MTTLFTKISLLDFKELNWAGLLAGDVFRRPKANVLITVDGLTKGIENCSLIA